MKKYKLMNLKKVQSKDYEEKREVGLKQNWKSAIQEWSCICKKNKRIPEVKQNPQQSSLASEALNELKDSQPEIKEENLDKEEEPLKLEDEVTKSE